MTKKESVQWLKKNILLIPLEDKQIKSMNKKEYIVHFSGIVKVKAKSETDAILAISNEELLDNLEFDQIEEK